VAETGELFARDGITQLRLVTQREQGLMAAGACAGASNLEHLFRTQKAALATARGGLANVQ
jgi:hypothetical protein